MVLDNSERSEYRQIFEKYNDKIHANYYQLVPDKFGFVYGGWTTTIWIK